MYAFLHCNHLIAGYAFLHCGHLIAAYAFLHCGHLITGYAFLHCSHLIAGYAFLHCGHLIAGYAFLQNLFSYFTKFFTNYFFYQPLRAENCSFWHSIFRLLSSKPQNLGKNLRFFRFLKNFFNSTQFWSMQFERGSQKTPYGLTILTKTWLFEHWNATSNTTKVRGN